MFVVWLIFYFIYYLALPPYFKSQLFFSFHTLWVPWFYRLCWQHIWLVDWLATSYGAPTRTRKWQQQQHPVLSDKLDTTILFLDFFSLLSLFLLAADMTGTILVDLSISCEWLLFVYLLISYYIHSYIYCVCVFMCVLFLIFYIYIYIYLFTDSFDF